MKRIEKLALEHVGKVTHPEGDPIFAAAIKVSFEAGFRACREMAAHVANMGVSVDRRDRLDWIRDEIAKIGEEEA